MCLGRLGVYGELHAVCSVSRQFFFFASVQASTTARKAAWLASFACGYLTAAGTNISVDMSDC